MGKRTDHFSGSYIGVPLTIGQWIELTDDLIIKRNYSLKSVQYTFSKYILGLCPTGILKLDLA